MRVPILLAAIATGLTAPSAPAQQCQPLDDATRSRIVNYAQGLYGNLAGEPLHISDASLDESTCIYGITFATSPSAQPFRRKLFLSPDHRYLTTAVYDVRAPLGTRQAFLNPGFAAFLRQHNVPTLGNKDAPILITAFGDYQCARCAALARIVRDELIPAMKDRVRVAFLSYPGARRKWAQAASEMVACARNQSEQAYWMMHNFLIENQDQLDAQNLSPSAEAFSGSIDGFDRAAFRQCVDSHATKAEVDAEANLARAAGPAYRPTLFLNGYEWIGPATAEELRQAIARLPVDDSASRRLR